MGHLALSLGAVAYNPPLICMAAGALIAMAGHVIKFRRVVAFGIALIFIGTAIAFLTAYQDFRQQGSPPAPTATNPYEQPSNR